MRGDVATLVDDALAFARARMASEFIGCAIGDLQFKLTINAELRDQRVLLDQYPVQG